MKAPDLSDTVVKATAYLSDADFGYENWHARQFASPRDCPTRPALLLICRDEAERDRLLMRLGTVLNSSSSE